MEEENFSAGGIKLDTKYNDQPHDMTSGRRIARFLSRYSWYFPHKDKEDGPSLDKAWAYFEHSTLPRHFPLNIKRSKKGRKKKSNYIKAEYGKVGEKTELYKIWQTPERELADFGVSAGVYFWNLRQLVIIMLLAGLLSLPNMVYFASSEYGQNPSQPLSYRMQGSAVCTNTSWVPCPNCTKNNWVNYESHYYEDTSNNLFFVRRNNCNVRLREGVVAFVTIIFTVIAIVYTIMYQSGQRSVKLDEGQQTTSDYAVEVFDPPEDAYDIGVWKKFFSQFGPVHSITITLDNEKLVNTLVDRRRAINVMKYMVEPDQKFDPDDLESMIQYCKEVSDCKKTICCAKNAESLVERIRDYEVKAIEIAKKEKPVSEVFAIFETEQGQRDALKNLSRPGWQRLFGCIPKKFKFNDEKYLLVDEAREPSSIRWNNLEETIFMKGIQLFISYTILFLFIGLGAVLVYEAGLLKASYAAYTITIINQITPRLCIFITNCIESHTSEGAKEASLYLKLTLFKWMNTAIITAIITPSIRNIDYGDTELINKVSAIFFTELITNPLLLYLDIWGKLQRHVFGPKSPDQDRMNQSFKGATYLISLRYTEMTKVLFLTFFYSAIYPAGFFWAAASLTVNYWVDKYCLLRVYGSAPTIGKQVSVLSRRVIFPLMLLAYVSVNFYNFVGWPFDNICDGTGKLPDRYIRNHTIEIISDGENIKKYITIEEDQLPVKYCSQDLLSLDLLSLDTIKKWVEWLKKGEQESNAAEGMTDDQEIIARTIGWTLLIMFAFTVLVLLRIIVSLTILRFFIKPYRAEGKASKETFSKIEEKFAYIPQVREVSGFTYPLLAFDMKGISSDYVQFEDPESEYPEGYHKHNLFYDLELSNDPVHLWSMVKTWGEEDEVDVLDA